MTESASARRLERSSRGSPTKSQEPGQPRVKTIKGAFPSLHRWGSLCRRVENARASIVSVFAVDGSLVMSAKISSLENDLPNIKILSIRSRPKHSAGSQANPERRQGRRLREPPGAGQKKMQCDVMSAVDKISYFWMRCYE